MFELKFNLNSTFTDWLFCSADGNESRRWSCQSKYKYDTRDRAQTKGFPVSLRSHCPRYLSHVFYFDLSASGSVVNFTYIFKKYLLCAFSKKICLVRKHDQTYTAMTYIKRECNRLLNIYWCLDICTLSVIKWQTNSC